MNLGCVCMNTLTSTFLQVVSKDLFLKNKGGQYCLQHSSTKQVQQSSFVDDENVHYVHLCIIHKAACCTWGLEATERALPQTSLLC